MSINISREPFGEMPDGRVVEKYTLASAGGAELSVVTYGGTILSIRVPDKHGKLGDVTLGYGSLPAMRAGGGYMNALIGRYANRISGASFELDGKTYSLAANDGGNSLHGGSVGFDQKIWDAEIIGGGVRLTLTSPDGDEGYPGELSVSVTYTLSDEGTVGILYEARTDRSTIVNLTNHAYFNLSGPGYPDLDQHSIYINADAITPVLSSGCIPTGKLMPVDGTPFDLRKPRNIIEGLALQASDEQMTFGVGYDHNFALNGTGMRLAAEVNDAASGRIMKVFTDQPGVQFYSGNHINSPVIGKAGVPYRYRQGFCLETQDFPDAPHHQSFPSVALRPGEKYRRETLFAFSAE